MPPARGGWVRVVAGLAVLAMVVSLGFSAVVAVQAPLAVVILVVAVLIGAPIWLYTRRDDRY